MRDYLKFYINGAWVDPVAPKTLDVINPATEAVAGRISMGSAADVDKAVKAARAAFETWSKSSVDERIALFEKLIDEYKKRYADMAAAITEEMGAPAVLSQKAQAAMGIGHLQSALAVLKNYHFQEPRGTTMIVKEPIGVCGLITPWNWPVNQIACKVAPALAVGCTMVLKPSEIAPFSAQVWTEIMHAAGVPAGVFNLVNGDGPTVGAAIGPVISATQWDKIQTLINRGIEEGAKVVAGGPGKPAGLETGYYVKPTVLGPVSNDKTVAREEIFGPVLVVIGYDTVDEAVAIANDTPYGLAAYVSGGDLDNTRQVASRLRAGQVNINSAATDLMAPFGGFKQSGNGREWGDHAFGEFLEIKAVLGYTPKAA